MKLKTQLFRENARAALQNPKLQAALRKFTSNFTRHRNQAVAETTGWEELRNRAHEIKQEAIQHLDVYLQQFASRVAERGGRVCWARTSEEACMYICQLARERGVNRIVKSKSMVTEEIELNHALQAAGFNVIETDLGEYIIQLLQDSPSHILAPAIHLTKSDVAKLFEQRLGIKYTEEVEELTFAVRATLRTEFLQAEMGITGANFAIAETGTLVVLENEGNARMTASLPKIQVAVVGIEKVVPNVEDLDVLLQVLARSATGQKLSSYVSLITGVKSHSDDEGPDELHVVMVDNGRTRILADPVQRDALECLRCGACLNVCPVYQRAGGHAYGWVYQGPIGALVTPQLVGLDKASDLPFASSLCGACKDVCPVKIDIPDLLLDLRNKIKEGDGTHTRPALAERVVVKLFALVMCHPVLYSFGARLLRLLQVPFVQSGCLSVGGVPGLKAWARTRDFPPLAPRSFREDWQRNNRGTA